MAAAPQTDADVPSVVLWHWKDPRTQATQQVQESGDRSFAYLASFDVAARTLSRLTDETMRTLQRGPRDTWGVGSDISAYERDASIKGFSYRDLYAVNLATSQRTPIQSKVPGGGFGGFSPDNARYVYYDTGDWKVYDFAKRTTRIITTGVDAKFWNTEDDHNQVKPPVPGGLLGWSRDGNSVIVRDNWDLWRLPVNGGAAVNLTQNGQRDQVRYQNRLVFDPRDRRGVDRFNPASDRIAEEFLGKHMDELVLAFAQEILEFDGPRELFAGSEDAGGIDFGPADLVAPPADRVEVLELPLQRRGRPQTEDRGGQETLHGVSNEGNNRPPHGQGAANPAASAV